MKIKIHIAAFALLLIAFSSKAQELRWSNYYAAMPTINAASTGAFAGDYRLIAGYRQSHYSAAEPFTTMYASYDQGINKHNKDRSARNTFFAVGLSFLNDNAGLGALTTTEVSALASFNLKLAENQYLSFGVKAAYGSKSINYDQFTWSSQFESSDGSFDPTRPSDPLVDFQKVNYLPFGTGIMWNYSDPQVLKLNAGLALNNINQPDVAFDPNNTEKLNRKIVANAGAELFIPNSLVSLMPLILFNSSSYYNEVNLGLFAKWYLSFDSRSTHLKKSSILYTGVFYRTTGDVVLAAKIDLRRNLSFGLSFDTDIGNDEFKGRTALEFVITYSGFFMERAQVPRKASTEFF